MLLKGKQVFIVEDNLQNRVIFQVILAKNGAQAYFERWGEGAVSQLKLLDHLDLIILDLMLANGISGYTIFDQIRALPRYDKIPIIAVSATEATSGITLTRQKGFMGFIAKPIDNKLFPTQIATILEGNQVWDAGKRILG